MKKLILFILLLVPMMAHSYREVLDGGGGVVDSTGQYSTFYSAKIPVVPEALRSSEIGGMSLLIERFAALEIPAWNKTEILKKIFPSGRRNYYKVDENHLDADTKNKILAQYAELMRVPQDQLVIYAVTDPKTSDTFLMSTFFKLSPPEQAAILFHESMWISSGPLVKYSDVIAAEQAVQAFLEHPESDDYLYNFYFRLAELTSNYNLPIPPIFKRESQKGFSWSQRQDLTGEVSVLELFGEKFLRCSQSIKATESGASRFDCSRLLLTELMLKSQLYPDSISIRYLIDYLSESGEIGFSTGLAGIHSKDFSSLKVFLADIDIETSRLVLPVYLNGEIVSNLTF